MEYYIVVDVSQAEIAGPSWRDYGRIKAKGRSLEQLKRNAQVEIVDFEGTILYEEAAASEWMQALIEQEFFNKYGGRRGGGTMHFVAPFLLMLALGCSTKAEPTLKEKVAALEASLLYQEEQVQQLRSSIDVLNDNLSQMDFILTSICKKSQADCR